MDAIRLQQIIAKFTEDRNWDQFHSPKNLAIALSVESSELLEVFQWLKDEQSLVENLSEKDLQLIKEEIADIQIYLLRLADKLGIDIETVTLEKIEKNAKKYPVKLSMSNATKYSRREEKVE